MFGASFRDSHEYGSAEEMARANYEFFLTEGKKRKLARAVFHSCQTLVGKLNEQLAATTNSRLNRKFQTKSHVLLGSNFRTVSTFEFEDESRAISIDESVLWEVAVFVYAISRDEAFGPWLAAWMLYHNAQSAKSPFPMIDVIARKCVERSPVIFDDIVRSCLYCLILHEVGHEYLPLYGADYADLTMDSHVLLSSVRKLCFNPPYGANYTAITGGDGRERILVPDEAWLNEFASDQFAFQATMSMVSDGTIIFENFEKALHHLTIWQHIIQYLSVGNLFRPASDRDTHPSADNRVDVAVFHLERIGIDLFGDWQSGALAILQKGYGKLFSVEFAGHLRHMTERLVVPQPYVYFAGDKIALQGVIDKEDPMPYLQEWLAVKLERSSLEKLVVPLETYGNAVKYGYDLVIKDMAKLIKDIELIRFDNDTGASS
jgi:hypothetical protein